MQFANGSVPAGADLGDTWTSPVCLTIAEARNKLLRMVEVFPSVRNSIFYWRFVLPPILIGRVKHSLRRKP